MPCQKICSMQERIIKYRGLIVGVSVINTIISLLMFPRLEVNSNLNDYVPDHLEKKVYLKKLDSIFGGSEMILQMLYTNDVINAATLYRLQSLAADLSQIKGIDRSITPFESKEISYEDGYMVM